MPHTLCIDECSTQSVERGIRGTHVTLTLHSEHADLAIHKGDFTKWLAQHVIPRLLPEEVERLLAACAAYTLNPPAQPPDPRTGPSPSVTEKAWKELLKKTPLRTP